jgi:hypothetical protein
MKIVVIGGSGLIGAKVVSNLRQRGHEVVAASPSTGVNTLTGEGLAEALAGAQVVVDVANSPSFEDKPALEFFETSGHNLLAGEAAAGVRHYVALSVVGHRSPAWKCRAPRSSASPARRSRRRTTTRAPSSAITSASTTSWTQRPWSSCWSGYLLATTQSEQPRTADRHQHAG